MFKNPSLPMYKKSLFGTMKNMTSGLPFTGRIMSETGLEGKDVDWGSM